MGHHSFHRLSRCIAVFAAMAQAGLVLPGSAFAASSHRIAAPIDESRLVTLAGGTHPMARAEFDQGPVATSGRMLLVLKRSAAQEADLQQLLRDQKDPASPSYRKWLTPDQFGHRFGISDTDYKTVAGYLRSKGFTVGRLSKGRGSLEISGTDRQLDDTFHVEMHRYAAGGTEFVANDRDPQVPEALAHVVAGIASLNNYRSATARAERQPTPKQVAFDPSTHTARPLFTTTTTLNGSSSTFYAVSPEDLATIYNIPAQSVPATYPVVGVVSDSNVNLQNIVNYNTLFYPSTTVYQPNVVVDGDDPGIGPNELATTEELELITTVSPYTIVNLYVAASDDYDTGLDYAAVRAVDDGVVNIVDFGFSICEANMSLIGNIFANATWEQAAAEGITVVAATGDSGAAACDTPGGTTGQQIAANGTAVNGFASTPYDTAVGGTDFKYTAANYSTYWNTTNSGTPAFSSAKSAIPQQPWNDSDQATDSHTTTPQMLYASGGGASSTAYYGPTYGNSTGVGYPVPSWQTAELGTKATTRAVPDVAMFAGDETNLSSYLICFLATDCQSGTTSTFTYAGGTAAASAVFSGIVARLVQTYSAQGNINPELYTLAASGTANAFYDVTAGTNEVACASGTTGCTAGFAGYAAGTGYDLASGLGAVNAGNLISKWASINAGTAPGSVTMQVYAPSTGTSLSSGGSITHGQYAYFNVTVANSGAKPAPTGDVSIITTNIQAGDKAVERLTLSTSGTTGVGNDYSLGVLLPGGTYTMRAHYAGDSNYAPAWSSPFTITVNAEPSEVLIMSACADLPINYTEYYTNQCFYSTVGTGYDTLGSDCTASGHNCIITGSPSVLNGSQVRVTVEPWSYSPGDVAIPSGYITVTDNGTAIAYLPLNSEGSATYETSTFNFNAGVNALNFSYSGDASYKPSTDTLNSDGNKFLNPWVGADQKGVRFNVTSSTQQTGLIASSSTWITSAANSSGPTNSVQYVVVVGSTAWGGRAIDPTTGTFTARWNYASGGNLILNGAALTKGYDANGNLVGTFMYTQTVPGSLTVQYNAGNGFNTVSIPDSSTSTLCSGTSCPNSTTVISTPGNITTYNSDQDLIFNVAVKANPAGGTCGTGCTSNVSGTVTLYANGTQIGSPVTLDSSGQGTLVVPKIIPAYSGTAPVTPTPTAPPVQSPGFLQMPSGSVLVTAVYSGGTAVSGSSFTAASSWAQPLMLTINGNALGGPSSPTTDFDFTIAALQSAQTLTSTVTSATYLVELAPNIGYVNNYPTVAVTYGCTIDTQPGLTCTVSGTGSVKIGTGGDAHLAGTSATLLTVTVAATSGYTLAQGAPPPAPRHAPWWQTAGGVSAAFALLLWLPARRRPWQALLAALLACGLAAGMSGCSGNPSGLAAAAAASGSGIANGMHPLISGTVPAGTYLAKVWAYAQPVSGGAYVRHNTTLNVVVQ